MKNKILFSLTLLISCWCSSQKTDTVKTPERDSIFPTWGKSVLVGSHFNDDILYVKDSTWIEEKTDTIRTFWVVIDSADYLKRLYPGRILYKYSVRRHSSPYLYNEYDYFNERYFIDGKEYLVMLYKTEHNIIFTRN